MSFVELSLLDPCAKCQQMWSAVLIGAFPSLLLLARNSLLDLRSHGCSSFMWDEEPSLELCTSRADAVGVSMMMMLRAAALWLEPTCLPRISTSRAAAASFIITA